MMPPYDVARKMARLADRVRGGKRGQLPPLLVMTDPDRTGRPLDLAEGVKPGSALIYRHYGAPNRFDTGRKLADLAARRGFVLLVSADLVLADRIRCEGRVVGIHWPEKWLHLAARQRGRGDRRLFTASAHNPAAAYAAAKVGVDTVIYSPVFRSTSPSAGTAKGVHAVSSLARSCAVGIHALGGVNLRTGPQLIGLGLSGIACVSGALDV
jgi:thiamine-phosphate pyrophosphorylase